MNFILEGGPIFMIPLLILLAVIVILFGKGIKNNTEKAHKLINSTSLFALIRLFFDYYLSIILVTICN